MMDDFEEEPVQDDEEWLATYADMVTLLMAFFVILYAMSDIRPSDFSEIRAGIIESLGGKDSDRGEGSSEQSAFQEAVKTMEIAMTTFTSNGSARVFEDAKGIQIEFDSSDMYVPGSARIRDAAIPALGAVARMIRKLPANSFTVEIEGHTDDVPISTVRYPSNWELSAARATGVLRFFEAQALPTKVMRAVAYADSRPKRPNLDQKGKPVPLHRAMNRRIVVKIERYGY